MGRIDIILPDKLEKRFRKNVYKKYGMKKGNLTKAITDALEKWIRRQKR